MSIKVHLKDGKGTGKELEIDENNSALTTDTGVPPKQLDVTLRPFVEFMKDLSDSEDMRVAASLAAPEEFFIGSSDQGDRFIHTLAFTISDAGASLNNFGNITALTNGCQIIYEDSELGDVVIGDALKSNFDFVQICNFEPTFGSGTAAFRASNVVGSSEAFIPILDMEDVFGMKYGLKIPKNSTKKIKIVVRDNTSSIDRFDVKVFGYDRISND